MSDLQRSFLKAKLAHLPRDPPMPTNPPSSGLFTYDEQAEEDEAENTFSNQEDLHSPSLDSSSESSASSTSTVRPLFARPEQPRRKSALESIAWNIYFSASIDLQGSDGSASYHVYFTPPALNGPLFVMHHGAGSSGLSFALLASEIRKILPSAGILSPDARAHGATSTADDSDLSLSTLASDLVQVVSLTKEHFQWPKIPDMVLVGHSLGGAVIADVAKSGKLGASVLGYSVLDVVEGSAMDALQSMQTYLSSRPAEFASLSQGIEWHIRSRTIRNSLSARVSVPALLANTGDDSSSSLGWRTDLEKTQPYWEGWFVGLSKKFLEAKGGKLLILAGTDRLDKELMIGQMQGKYQLVVFPDVGHFLHEDAPEKTASVLVEFYKRNDRSALVLPPKVSEMYKKA